MSPQLCCKMHSLRKGTRHAELVAIDSLFPTLQFSPSYCLVDQDFVTLGLLLIQLVYLCDPD